MTFKDLKKRVTLEITQQQSKLSERLYNKPFWIWNIEEHKQQDVKTNGDCCFNHIIGLPTKEGVKKPIFDYEKILYDALLVNEYLQCSKSFIQAQTSMGKEKHWLGSYRVLPQVNGMAMLEKQ